MHAPQPNFAFPLMLPSPVCNVLLGLSFSVSLLSPLGQLACQVPAPQRAGQRLCQPGCSGSESQILVSLPPVPWPVPESPMLSEHPRDRGVRFNHRKVVSFPRRLGTVTHCKVEEDTSGM